MNGSRLVFVVVAFALVGVPAAAHVPGFPVDNDSPETALVVDDAAKSWSFYDRLSPGEVSYYRLELAPGQRLRVGAFTPTRGAFTPSLVLLSPSLNGTDGVPAGVTVPDGMGAVVYPGDRPEVASYEPFAPSANYHTVDVDRTVETGGTYLVAVYDPADRGGPVGLAVGSEERFSPTEYLRVPFDLVRTHLWEGQHPLLVAAPWLVTGGLGLTLLRRRGSDATPPVVRYGLGGAALLVLGTAASAAMQMGLALTATGPTGGALLTALFVVVPALCGGWVLSLALGEGLRLEPQTRLGLVVAALLSLAAWAGFVVAPVVVLAVAAMPAEWVAGSG